MRRKPPKTYLIKNPEPRQMNARETAIYRLARRLERDGGRLKEQAYLLYAMLDKWLGP
jgi:hypothetical protein